MCFLVRNVYVFFDKNAHEFFLSKMSLVFLVKNVHEFFLWVRYAMGKISINNPHSGVGLAHEKFNSL